jgi:copper chaperone CopZ
MILNVNLWVVGAAVAALMGVSSICGICQEAASRSHWVPAIETMVDTATVKLAIKGMTCGGCATAARMALQRAEGVYRAEVSFETATGVVQYDPRKTNPEALIAHLKKLTGFEAQVLPVDGRAGSNKQR